MTTRRFLAAGLVLVAALLIGLVAAEMAVRTATAVSARLAAIMQMQDPMSVKIEPHGEDGYRPRPGVEFRYRNGAVAHENSLGYRGPAVPFEKPPGTLRIVLLGGSTAHGWGVNDDQTIAAYLSGVLAHRDSSRRYEVISLAFDGYDSWQDFERFRTDGIPLRPDVVVLHSGINDVRNARFPALRDRDPRTMLWSGELARLRREGQQGGPAPWTRAKHLSYTLRLAAHLRQEARRQANPDDLMHPADRVTIQPNLEAADYFERNVRRVVDLAGAHGIAVLLSTPPSALRIKYPPEARSAQSYWINDAQTTQSLRDSLDRRFARIAAEAPASGPGLAHVHFELAAEHYLDDCHLTPEGNRAVAGAMADAILALRRRSTVAPQRLTASGRFSAITPDPGGRE